MKYGIPSKRTIVALAEMEPAAKRPRFVAGCSSCKVICAMGREGGPDMSCVCCLKEGRRSELGVKMRRPSGTIHERIPIGPIAEYCRNTMGDRLMDEACASL